MRGKPPAVPLTVSDRQRDILEKEYCKVNIRASFKQRVSIIVAGIQGVSFSETGRDLGISLNTVRKWRRRWEYLPRKNYVSLNMTNLANQSKIILYARR